MDVELTKKELRDLLAVIRPSGQINVDAFQQLRDVNAKFNHVLILLDDVEGIPPPLINNMRSDPDFQANSRFVRLKALTNHIDTALAFLDKDIYRKPGFSIQPVPDIAKLTGQLNGLKEVIESRWIESQKCQQQGCHLSAVILMGSILEALLLGRALLDQGAAYRAGPVPKHKDGRPLAIPDWTLNALVDVAVDVGWVKHDRGRFGHSLRESRNIVHPWAHVTSKANFDEGTCKTCWEVLNAAVQDLIKSLP